ncbi:MAG: SPOR domain-containing protein [Bacteroidales bacterium]|nr:SPOR domain-containing protein [Bacteroidales bacterium]
MKYISKYVLMQVVVVYIFILVVACNCNAQEFIKASYIFPVTLPEEGSGRLSINHKPGVDTLLSRYILLNKLRGGLEGFRIQIYRSSNRNAREESNKVRAQFIVDFPDIPSYIEYDKPGYFLVRVGDFRTKMEGTKTLYMIRNKYPNAYMVPCIINFPDLDND